MIGTGKLLMLTLLFSASSSMFYKRQKLKWPTIASKMLANSPPSSQQPSNSMLEMRKHLNAAYKAKSRSGIRATWSRDTCKAQVVFLKLDPPITRADTCSSVLVQSWGCRGGCSSYSQVDTKNTSNIIHTCNCCKPLRSMIYYVVIPCKIGKHIRVPIKDALGCSCRPCYMDKAPRDMIEIRDLMTRTAVDTDVLG